jgi:hypothetical protein
MAQQVASERLVNGIKTRVLHGKDYVEVHERVHQVYEQKSVLAIVKSEPMEVAGRWIWVAVLTVDGNQFIGNAEIKFDAPKNSPDGTNPFECAETSAIGRALAFAGFGSVEAIASKDEVMRGQPYSIQEVANPHVIESSQQPRQLVRSTVPSAKEIYQAGKLKDMWTDSKDFFVAATATLDGFLVTEKTVLTETQRDILHKAVEQEQAKAS